MKGSTDVRRMADVSTEALNYSEIKAIATGNPLIMEKATLDNTIRQLSAQKRAHTNTNYRIRQELNRLPDKIDKLTERIEATTADVATATKAQARRRKLRYLDRPYRCIKKMRLANGLEALRLRSPGRQADLTRR